MSDLQQIDYIKIHPAIGVARVGNSTDQYYLAPDLPYPQPEPENYYRDENGALKRQGVRFRIYGYAADGTVVAELTLDDEAVESIEWDVCVANKKAAWYDFVEALDLKGAPSGVGRRNAMVTNRESLMIEPPAQQIGGRGVAGKDHEFVVEGAYWGKSIYLGELRTDEEGRLIFLGGRGESASKGGVAATTFANNEGWHDDTSDGYVHATVTINGKRFKADGVQGGAWVVTAPPNYAPDIFSVSTMYDLMLDTAHDANWVSFPDTVSFTKHILPILREFSMNGGVNEGFEHFYGYGRIYDFNNPKLLRRLSDKTAGGKERQTIFGHIRNPNFQSPPDRTEWPWMYGDQVAISPPFPRYAFFAITKYEYKLLKKWSEGDFVDDYTPDPPEWPSYLDEVPLAEQPATLDKASMIYCLGGPFHPGCEMTWPMRHSSMYMEPFRIKLRQDPEPDYGPELTPTIVASLDGPLNGSLPGDITRWMAVPWQTDTASCRSGYEQNYAPYLPTFWPATVPNSVLSEEDYKAAIDPDLPIEVRVAAYHQRVNWYRILGNPKLPHNGFYFNQPISKRLETKQVNHMVKHWPLMGLIVRVEIPEAARNEALPDYMYVEFLPDGAEKYEKSDASFEATSFDQVDFGFMMQRFSYRLQE